MLTDKRYIIRIILSIILMACINTIAYSDSSGNVSEKSSNGASTMMNSPKQQAQMKTSYRLLKIGESIDFMFDLPEGMKYSQLSIYPRYLEMAKPGKLYSAGDDLKWVDKLPKEDLRLDVKGGYASIKYTPKVTGSYLAKWTAGDETFYRYFSVIDDDYVVLSFSPFCPLEPDPTLHSTGIPLDYRLPADKFKPGEPIFDRFIEYNRLHGDNIIPMLPDTPDLDRESRLDLYSGILSNVRALLPDANDCRSAWIEVNHEMDPGYIDILSELGINDHCGLACANAKPWLGMPEFPYFSSTVDARKMNQTRTGKVVSHQWDFCGGWHFAGPVSWHYKVSEGDWKQAEKCITTGIKEFENLSRMSGHPAFVNPLYEALDVGIGYPNPDFEIGTGEPRNFNGEVDDIFVCKRALSDDDIKSVMNNGVGTLSDPLVIWDFDDELDNVDYVNGAHRIKGRNGGVLALDGKDDYMISDSPVSIDTVDFSMGCWVKPGEKQKQWANILSSHNAGGGYPFRGISFEQNSDNANMFRLIAGDGTGWFVSGDVQLKANEWQHLAAVRHGRKLMLYLNGVPVVTNELQSDAPFPPATDRFKVGDWSRGVADSKKSGEFLKFVERYQKFIAFELPKKHNVVFARSLDAADYYRRHFSTTPKTLFVSKTDHVMYDIWWTYQWDCARYYLVTRERLPWLTRVSKVPRIGYKDPLSYEFILVEDSRWSIRFERECPNPIWRFDYRVQETESGKSAVKRTETPDVHIPKAKWIRKGDKISLTLKMNTDASFEDYAIAVWDLPKEVYSSKKIMTTAKEHVLVRNTDGEYHLVLFFDLKPNLLVKVTAQIDD
ncbi:MAG: LamG domain-containing protein [Armatimonadota bacterium]